MKHGRLAGKVAIVTGAAPQATGVGNGSAVGVLFAREGAKVVLVNRSESRCPRTAAHHLAKEAAAELLLSPNLLKRP
jgi:NAD(P)-dependent dehydrogenase (short-subunit alcohol dehydrogenase family)